MVLEGHWGAERMQFRGAPFLIKSARPKTLAEIKEPELCAALGLSPRPVWIAPPGFNDSAIVQVENEAEVRAVSPDFVVRMVRRSRAAP